MKQKGHLAWNNDNIILFIHAQLTQLENKLLSVYRYFLCALGL